MIIIPIKGHNSKNKYAIKKKGENMKNLSIQQINEIYKELAYTIMTEKEFLKIVKNITEKEKEPSIIIEKIREYILKIIDKD